MPRNKKKFSEEEHERILVIVRKSAVNYQETNRILDEILPDSQTVNHPPQTHDSIQ